MNKHIEDIKKQSNLEAEYDGQEFAIAKFAKLLIIACARLADDPNVDVLRIGKSIKEHFGIEESDPT